MFEFKIKNTHRKARAGFFNTPHGKIKTPNLAVVATHGKIKLLNKTDERRANPDLIIANTFHLFVNDKVKEIKKIGGLHKWSGFKKPIMTDSGGFQVFSLGWGRIHGIGKVGSQRGHLFQKPRSSTPTWRMSFDSQLRSRALKNFERSDHRLARLALQREAGRSASETFFQRRSSALNLVQIFEDRVVFDFNSKQYELSPETSIKIQQDLGADIIFAFDECTSPLHSYSYTKKAMERTHRWANRCLAAAQNQKSNIPEAKQGRYGAGKNQKQALFGIVQGGIFEDLRRKSSKFIGSLSFDGFGIGGSFGEKQMRKVLEWSLSGLPEEKPRHLLGIGKIKDIFVAVKQGIDLFDCVVPTREARHGVLYTKAAKLNIEKEIFKKDKKLIEKDCGCWVCRQGITRQELRHYFKINRILGQRLATIHNIYFFRSLFQEIRQAIVSQKLEKLEREYYNYL